MSGMENMFMDFGIPLLPRGCHGPTNWEGVDEVNGVFDQELQLHWFTDFTRPKSGSGAMVSYSILNARTGKFTFFTEGNGLLNGKSAMNVAEKTFRANKYEAGTPILYTIMVNLHGLYR